MKNIKNSLQTIVVVLFTYTGFAQSNKIDIQVEGGPSLISVNGMTAMDAKPTFKGFAGGLSFNYNINALLSIKSGVSYDRKGFRDSIIATLSNGQSAGFAEFGVNLDYLVVPLLLRANFGDKLRFFINGGPYIGYLIKQQYILMLPNSPRITDANLEKKFDLGISGGIGCSYPLNDLLSISVEARNNLALVSYADAGKIKTNSINFNLGITYHLKDSK